jgi:outer membrane receptor protein involved in Fe transport
MRELKALVVGAATSLLCTLLLLSTAYARAAEPAPQSFDIRPQSLAAALNQFARQSHEQILFTPDVVAKKFSSGVRGNMPPLAALQILLKDSGLTYASTPNGAILVGNPGSALVPPSTRNGGSSGDPSKEGKNSSSSGFLVAQVDQGQVPSAKSVGAAHGIEQATSGPVSLEEIVVTAQKRQERLQDVPMSVSAFTQEDINQLGISGIDTLSRQVPNLAFSNPYGGEPILSIRGISTGYGLAPAVSVYIDDTPLDTRTDLFSGSGLIDLFDVDRIEVLRGPQGTLFGASSMGGAIRVITAQPSTKQFNSNWEAGFADTDGGGISYSAKGAVNIPLSDTLALRVVATHSEDGGWIDRALPTDFSDITPGLPITKRNENTDSKTSFRLAMRWEPDDTWAITPSFIYQNTGTVGQPSYYPDAGLFVRPHLFSDEGSFNTAIGNIKIEKDLGWSTATSSTAYMSKSTNYIWDYSEYGQYFSEAYGIGSEIPALPYDVPVTYHQVTEELRLTSANTGVWRWLVGAYFNNTTQNDINYSESDAFLSTGSSLVYYYDAPVHDHQTAEFGELTLSPNKYLEFTAGLRGYQLRTTEQITQGGFLAGADVPKTTEAASGLNPKVTATWKLDQDLNVYATAAKGFRAGGPNAGIFSGPCNFLSLYKSTYEPDSVWNYEAGSKATFLNGRASLNASVFQMNWNNFQGQVSSTCGVFTANIGTVRIRGVEFESKANINQYVTLHASYSYDDAKIHDLGAGFEDAGVGAVGEQIVNVPRAQFTFGGELDLPLTVRWSGFLRSDWQHVGSAQTSYVPFTGSTRPAYSNVDLTAGLKKAGWDLELYAHNLANSLQIVGITPPVLDGPVYLTNRPRTIGVTVRYAY